MELTTAAAPKVTSAPQPTATEEIYDHASWLDDFRRCAKSLGFTPMEIKIVEITHAAANFKTGETFIGGKKVAAKMQHATTNRTTETWSKAATKGLMTRAYGRPNEGTKHFRRLLPSANWTAEADPDGGRRRSPEPGYDSPVEASPSPEPGDTADEKKVIAHNDDLDRSDPTLYQNDQRTDPVGSAAQVKSDPIAEGANEILAGRDEAGSDDLRGAMITRGVSAQTADSLLEGKKEPDRQVVRDAIGAMDESRANGNKIANADKWILAAVAGKYRPSAAPTRQPDYTKKEEKQRRVEERAFETRMDAMRQRIASMTNAEKESLLNRALDLDEQRAAEVYRKSRSSLRSQVREMRDARVDPFRYARPLAAVAELLAAEESESQQ